MDHARQVLPTALAQAVRLAPLTPEKVEFAWRAAGGPAIAKATRVSLDDSGLLTVQTGDARWATEIHRLRHDLIRSLATWLGAGVVTRLDVAGRPEHGRRRRRVSRSNPSSGD
jgi:predicted nucleic acid-binding Zn ribbon protein